MNNSIYLLFVDFKQAYDNIIQKKIWESLTNLGISTKIVRLIKLRNSKTK